MYRSTVILLAAATLLCAKAQDDAFQFITASNPAQTGGDFQISISLDLPVSIVSVLTGDSVQSLSTAAVTASAESWPSLLPSNLLSGAGLAKTSSQLPVSLDLPESIMSIITTYSLASSSLIVATSAATSSAPSPVDSPTGSPFVVASTIPASRSTTLPSSMPSSSDASAVTSSSSAMATSSSASSLPTSSQISASTATVSASMRTSITSSTFLTPYSTQVADTFNQPSRYFTSTFSNADRAQYDRLVIAHAAIGSIAWLITSPLVILLTLWPRHDSRGSSHSSLQSGWYDLLQSSTTGLLTLISIVIGAIASGMASSGQLSNAHGQLSVVLLILLALQIIVSRIFAWSGRRSRSHTQSSPVGLVSHVIFSFVLTACGFAAIYTGFNMYDMTARKSTPLSVVVIWAILVSVASLGLLTVTCLLVLRRRRSDTSRRGSQIDLDRSNSANTVFATPSKADEKGATVGSAASQTAANPFEQVGSESAETLAATAESSTFSLAIVAGAETLIVPNPTALTRPNSYHSALSWHTEQGAAERSGRDPFAQIENAHHQSESSASSTDDLRDAHEVQVIRVPRTLPDYSFPASASTPALTRDTLGAQLLRDNPSKSQIPVRKRRVSHGHKQVKRKAVPQYLV